MKNDSDIFAKLNLATPRRERSGRVKDAALNYNYAYLGYTQVKGTYYLQLTNAALASDEFLQALHITRAQLDARKGARIRLPLEWRAPLEALFTRDDSGDIQAQARTIFDAQKCAALKTTALKTTAQK